MEFWDGLVSTALVIGVFVCGIYILISLLMPELAPEERSGGSQRKISPDRWLMIGGTLYLIAIGLELSKWWLDETVFGIARLVIVGAGLAIMTVLGTDFLVTFRRPPGS